MPIGILNEKNEFVETDPQPLDSAEDSIGYLDIIGATFRQENTIGSFLSQGDDLPDIQSSVARDYISDNAPHKDYRKLATEEGFNNPDYMVNFDYVRTDKEYASLKTQIEKETADRDLIAKSGTGTQILAELTAGIVDLDATMLIPALKAAKTASKVANVALDVGKFAGMGAIASVSSEALLKETQVTRDDDYYAALVGGALLGGALGGGVAALRKSSFDIDSLEQDIGRAILQESDNSELGIKSLSAAETKATTSEQEGLAGGKVAKGLAGFIAQDRALTDNPVLQALTSPFKTTKVVAQQLAETTGLRIKKAEEGLPVGFGLPAIETMNKLARGAVAKTEVESKRLWSKMLTGEEKGVIGQSKLSIQSVFDKTKMSYRDFQREVGLALKNNDTHDIPEIQEMAKIYRKDIFEPLKDRAVSLDLLPEGVTPDTAASYFTRVYDIDRIVKNSDKFDDVTTKWLSEQQDIKASLQDEIQPLYDEFKTVKSSVKRAEKQLIGRGVTVEKLKAQTEEGFRFLKDIRSRIGVGKNQIDSARKSFDELQSAIVEMETKSDFLVDQLNKELGGKLPEINKKLLQLFQSKKTSFKNKVSFDRMVKKAGKNPDKFKPSVKYPVLNMLKGMIHPDGDFAKQLKAMDITPNKFPAYFSKNGMRAFDNLPRSELPDLDAAITKDFDSDNTYFEVQELLDAIDSEMRGDPILYDDKDQGRFNDWQEIDDFKSELQERGIDLDSDEAFEQYQRSKDFEASIGGEEQRTIDDLESELDDINFYDRAQELLPSLINDLDEALKKIKNKPALKKIGLDKKLNELKNSFDDIERQIKSGREKAKKLKDSRLKGQEKFDIKEKERGIIDRTATRRAKKKVSTLIRKIEESHAVQRSKSSSEFKISQLKDKLETLVARWQGKSSKEFKSLLSKGAEGKAFDDAFEKAIRKVLDTDTRLIDSELRYLAGEIRDRIISSKDGRLPYERDMQVDGSGKISAKGFLDDTDKPSMFKNRAFAIPDNLINDFVINDADVVASSYYHRATPYMNMYERFNGDTELVNLRSDLRAEKEASLRELEGDRSQAAEKKRDKINKQYENDIRAIVALRQRALGRDFIAGDPTRLGARIPQAVRTFNVVTLLGGMTVSAIPDLGRLVALQSSSFNQALKPIIKNITTGNAKVVAKKFRENNYFGVVVELVGNNRVMQLGDITDDIQPRTRIERAIQYMGDKTGIATLMAPWNESLKQIASITTEHAIFDIAEKLSKGKASAKEVSILADNRIDKAMAKRILDQYKQFGENHKGLKLLNLQDWSDIEARTNFLAALTQEVDRIILTPGYDKSVSMTSSELKKMLWQFKSFFAKATTNLLIRGIQDIGDMRSAASFTTMMGLGMMVYASKTMQANKELSDNPAIWLIEGFDRAGIGGIAMEANNIIEKGMGVGLRPLAGGEVSSRYASRSVADSFLGPTYGMLLNIARIARVIGTQEINEGDINAMIRLIPYQNHPLLAYPKNRLKEALIN